MINFDRWRFATDTYPAALRDYREMVINHETGHALGFPHAHCSIPGGLAPVMQQQSKGLEGCRRNPWPLRSERTVLAQRLGVAIRPAPPGLQIGASIDGVRIGMTAEEVVARLGRPTRRVRGGREAFTFGYKDDPVEVSFAAGTVTAVSTVSPLFRAADTLGVGSPLSRLARLSVRPTCNPVECVIGHARLAGDRSTSFLIHNGRVARVTLQRLVRNVPPPNTFLEDSPQVVADSHGHPVFTFRSSLPYARFECGIDHSPYSRCSSPLRLGALADGLHVFRVRAADPIRGHDPTPAARTFRVSTRPATATLTLLVQGQGTITTSTGASCSASCEMAVAVGEAVAVTAAPLPGWQFVSWDGACAEAASETCLLAPTGPATVRANFAQAAASAVEPRRRASKSAVDFLDITR